MKIRAICLPSICRVGLAVAFALNIAGSSLWAQSPPPANRWEVYVPRTVRTVTQGKDLSGATIPGRIIETTSKDRSQEAHGQVLEILSVQGQFEPSSASEQETLAIDPHTVRVISRFYGKDADGRRMLIRLTEEERRTLPDGAARVESTTSETDGNGHFRITRQEIRSETPVGADSRKTRITVLVPSINGGFAPAAETEQLERSNGGEVELHSTTRIPDGNGAWIDYEGRESHRQNSINGVQTEEFISRLDSEGNFTLAEHTVDHQWKAAGDERRVLEIYATGLSGTAPYGDKQLHLDRRLTTSIRALPDGRQEIQRQMERPNPLAPNESLMVTSKEMETSSANLQGGRDTRNAVQTLDGNGRLQDRFIFESKQEPQK